MDDFLTPVSTKVMRTEQSKPLIHEHRASASPSVTRTTIESPDIALQALKEEPSFETVSQILRFLATESDRKDGFSLIKPDPVSANIAYQLVNRTIPDYWKVLKKRTTQNKQLIRCLRNPCGVGAIIARLRPLIADCRQKKPVGQERDASSYVEDLLEFLKILLEEDRTSVLVWQDVQMHARDAIQGKMMWREFVTQVASGRILSLAAEAEDVLKERISARNATWLSDGSEYGSWLGRNIAAMTKMLEKDEASASAMVEICSKALSLGYTDRVVSSMMLNTLSSDSVDKFTAMLQRMKSFEQRKYMSFIVTFVAKQYSSSTIGLKDDPIKAPITISAAAALIYTLIKDSESLKESLVSTLTKSSIPALDDSLLARRSVIAAIAQDEDQLHSLLENSLKLFGDAFYVKHTPILQQEGLAQTLAITSGYVQRSQPMFLTMMAKSSYHVSGMSNRIGASSTRARTLGIFVGMAISKMVDKPELQLKFELEGAEADEAKWYQRLTEANDKLGKIEDLKPKDRNSPATTLSMRPISSKAKPSAPKKPNTPAITEIKCPRIVEVLSDSEDDDDDLVPYDKPDSDPEDETDDPTEINRDKPTAPVYIRDLLTGLRDQENYDRHVLAFSTAAPLISRKANFGTEVADHIEELASILTGLHNNLDLDDFEEKRQQALIAVLLAKPKEMAQWFAKEFFSGDYSLSQRTAMLTTIGLGARELAGLKSKDTEDLMPPKPAFPSKQLPPQLHALYSSRPSSSPTDSLGRITSNIAKTLLSPLAAQAADSLTGPSILKVRTFSSRMDVEKRRQKPIPNALAQMVADHFFFPLTGRWWIQMRSDTSGSSIYTSTHLLPPFLQTLALLMQAAGPSTLALPQMTREMWDLLLGARGLAMGDKRILGAVLFAFMMLLETNLEQGERLANEQGRELMETLEWAKMVFEGLPGGAEGGEEERVRVLAAGVVVRAQEVVEKYQRRLVGSMMDY